MATKHILKAKVREIKGRKVKQLRATGLIPANVFGKSQASINVQVANKDFAKVYAEAGESSLIYLEVEGEKDSRPVLVRDVSHHPVTGYTLHVDFNQVSLKEKVVAPVSVNLVGESPAEQEKLGILVQQLDEVELEALPTEMPESLEVSIENLKAVGDSILVKDITMASGVTIKSDPEAIVAKIEALAKEEVVEAPVAEAEATTEGETPAATEAPAAAENSDQESKS